MIQLHQSIFFNIIAVIEMQYSRIYVQSYVSISKVFMPFNTLNISNDLTMVSFDEPNSSEWFPVFLPWVYITRIDNW